MHDMSLEDNWQNLAEKDKNPIRVCLWETQRPMNMTERALEHGLSEFWISLLVDTFNINLIYYPYRGLAIPWPRVVRR